MQHLLLDTGRSHGWGCRRDLYRHVAFEDLPDKERMSERRTRGQGDRLAPLHRYLDRQVGRPWNDVWSEICAHADRRSLRGFHLRNGHVQHEVDPRDMRDVGRGWYGYYIDDRRLLRKYARRKRRQPKADTTRLPINSISSYEKHAGCWFYVERGSVEKIVRAWRETTEDEQMAWRVETRRLDDVVVTKRQLGRRELRRLGLRNHPG
jgi:hypothetical protein